jgi:DNA replication initiation complex subunit (GINS family)
VKKDGNIKNLKPFKPGQSGNPKGRPKLPDLKDLLEELGDEGMREVIEALHKQAKKGNVKAIETLLDRYYGKVKQQLDLSGEIKQTQQPDLSNLTDEEKKQFGQLRKRANGIND